jgi:dethiobiotin synthetase
MGSVSLAENMQGIRLRSKRKEALGSLPDLTAARPARSLRLHVNYFITGTDTGVGKTYLTALMITALRAEGVDATGFKPISCGDRGDGISLAEASGGLPIDDVNPLHFASPVAPHVAALLENRSITPADLVTSYHRFAENHGTVLVEGAGGWEVPITEKYFISDLAKDLNLPVILIAANRLGALNHILLSIAAIRAKGLTCAGIILNQLEDEMDTPMITNKGILESLTDVPLLDHIIHGQDFISQELFDVLTGEPK